MLRTKNKLTIMDNDNGVFNDYSIQGLDYDRDTFTITMVDTTSFLYVGFYKPINMFYIELATANVNGGDLIAEYYNGTTWLPLKGIYDESGNFSRSAFIQWDRNQTDEAETTIDSVDGFYYRFSTDTTTSPVTFKGLNLVYSDDTDLKREFFEIGMFLPKGETSHILTHVASRDQIIQRLRDSAAFKSKNGVRKDINAFDLHDVAQIKLASTYLTLSKIFGAVTDDPDDTYKDKAKEHKSNYSLAIKTPFIDVDTDDDGIRDQSETKIIRTSRIFRE